MSQGGESVTVLTPFHRLVVAARHAAFKNEPVTPSEVSRVLRQDAGRLVMWVQLRGKREDFARHFAPKRPGRHPRDQALLRAERAHGPAPGGRRLRGPLRVRLPLRDLNGRDRLALRVADSDGRDVSRFTIDLSTMR